MSFDFLTDLSISDRLLLYAKINEFIQKTAIQTVVREDTSFMYYHHTKMNRKLINCVSCSHNSTPCPKTMLSSHSTAKRITNWLSVQLMDGPLIISSDFDRRELWVSTNHLLKIDSIVFTWRENTYLRFMRNKIYRQIALLFFLSLFQFLYILCCDISIIYHDSKMRLCFNNHAHSCSPQVIFFVSFLR